MTYHVDVGFWHLADMRALAIECPLSGQSGH